MRKTNTGSKSGAQGSQFADVAEKSRKAIMAATKKVNAVAQRAGLRVAAAAGEGADGWRRSVVIGGKTYDLEFGINNLCAAEQKFTRSGYNANLLFALSVTTLNLNRLRDLFAAAVSTNHPELGYEGAIALVTPETVYDIANAAYSVLMVYHNASEAVVAPKAEPSPESEGAAVEAVA